MKHLIFDCGGVLVYPRLGDWNVPFQIRRILGNRAADIYTARYLYAHRDSADWLDESRRVPDIEEERRLRREYLRAINARMEWHLDEETIELLTDDFTDNIQRYGFFNDVTPWLYRWKQSYSLGLLSDAMPSMLVFLRQYGIADLFDGMVISTQIGATKPDRRMFDAILDALNADPRDCLYIDDMARNLAGAQRVGMRCVQMARSASLPQTLWDGPVVQSFEALNRLLER